MLDKLFGEKVVIAPMLSMAGAILTRLGNGPDPLSPDRIAREALSNPVPWRYPQTTHKEKEVGK